MVGPSYYYDDEDAYQRDVWRHRQNVRNNERRRADGEIVDAEFTEVSDQKQLEAKGAVR